MLERVTTHWPFSPRYVGLIYATYVCLSTKVWQNHAIGAQSLGCLFRALHVGIVSQHITVQLWHYTFHNDETDTELQIWKQQRECRP